MDHIAKTIGERLRKYRKDAGLTQEGLAEKADLHPTYIGQLERGAKNATLESIVKVARALELPLEVLFVAIVEGGASNAAAKEIYRLASVKSEKEQQALLDLVKKILEYKNT